MEHDDLDRFLSDDEIVPSSGFTARVMDAVRAEASMPPAIPFPWLRALPGIAAVAIAFFAIVAGFIALGRTGVETSVSTSLTLPPGTEVTWLLLVVLATVSFVKVYEEPTLRRQFPAEYDAYVAAVPGWIPRLKRPG